MQRLRAALCLVFVVLLGGCGDDPPKATGPAALKYVPADADAVLVVPTDLQGEQLQRLGALLEPSLREDFGGDIRNLAASLFDDTEVNFARDVEPLLGEDLVLAAWGRSEEDSHLLAVIDTPDGERAAKLARRLDVTARVDGDTRFTVPTVVFGALDDDRFEVASGLDKVRGVSDLELSDVDGAHGGAVARADFSTWDSDPLGLETVPLGAAVGELEASREGIDARLRIAIK